MSEKMCFLVMAEDRRNVVSWQSCSSDLGDMHAWFNSNVAVDRAGNLAVDEFLAADDYVKPGTPAVPPPLAQSRFAEGWGRMQAVFSQFKQALAGGTLRPIGVDEFELHVAPTGNRVILPKIADAHWGKLGVPFIPRTFEDASGSGKRYYVGLSRQEPGGLMRMTQGDKVTFLPVNPEAPRICRITILDEEGNQYRIEDPKVLQPLQPTLMDLHAEMTSEPILHLKTF